jgi:hypothetical protein
MKALVMPFGECPPQALAGVPARQVQTHLAEQLAYPATDLDQPKPQSIQLHPPHTRLHQPLPEHVQQPVSRRVQQKPGNWLAKKRLQLNRSAFRPNLKSFMRFSVSPRPT